MKSPEERNVPEFFQLYAAGDRQSALALLRSLDFNILDAMLVVRKAETGADLAVAREIVLASSAYSDLAEEFWRQQNDFWAVVTEWADEVESDEQGNVSATFDLTKPCEED
jgi:hypothetical protein